jgi:hypothetical protein
MGQLVVINDFHSLGAGIAPQEAKAPLVIDADAVLAGPIPFQGF